MGKTMKPSIEHTHSNWLPSERMTFLGIAERLDQKLTSILSTELSLGNLIYEAMEGSARARDSGAFSREAGEWHGMNEGCLCVLLMNPFMERHDLPEGVVFIEGEPGTHDSRGPEYRITSGTHVHVLGAPNR